MNEILKQLKQNPFVLAPMAGITDNAFRSFMKQLGSSIVVSELVSATGLRYNSSKTKELMQFSAGQKPVGIQIFGENLEDLDYAAKTIEQMGADFVDLNFGCPVPKVVKKGAGAALLKDLHRAAEIFKTLKAATTLSVTVKVRTGWDETSRNSLELCHIAYNEGLTWVAIHGRTRAQAYKGKADWNYIKEVKRNSKIPIIGNGDICTAKQAVDKMLETQSDGVMIGRGCLKNPWLFKEALNLWRQVTHPKYNSDLNNESFAEIFKLLDEHYSKTSSTKVRALQLKKLSAWYSSGFPGSAGFRKEIFRLESPEQVLSCINNYFKDYKSTSVLSSDNEGFLMGGHG